MRVIPAYLVESDDGVPLRTFAAEADALLWLNKLSAARQQRDEDQPVEHKRLWGGKGAGLRKYRRDDDAE